MEWKTHLHSKIVILIGGTGKIKIIYDSNLHSKIVILIEEDTGKAWKFQENLHSKIVILIAWIVPIFYFFKTTFTF